MSEESEKKEVKESIRPAIDDSAFEALEKDFQNILRDLQGNGGLDKFRDEYEKIMRALNKSHDSEKRLMQKCRELKAEIVSNASKVATAVKLSQEDQTTISSLKKEIEKAWKMVDSATEKENKARETIQNLKLEISNLTKLVEQGAGLSGSQDLSVTELLRVKEQLTKERDGQMADNKRLRDLTDDSKTRIAKLEADIIESQNKVMELDTEIQTRNIEAQRELRKKEKMEKELKTTKADIEAKNDEIKSITLSIEKQKQELKIKDDEISRYKADLEHLQRQHSITDAKLKEQQGKLDNQILTTNGLAQENQNRALELKNREDEVNSLKNEVNKLTKLKEATNKKLRSVEDQKADIDRQREKLKSEISRLTNELDTIKKEQEEDKRKCEELTKERDNLNRLLKKASDQTNKQIELVKMHETSKRNLEQEIQNYKEEAQKQRKIIFQLEKERDRYINEASDLTQKVLNHMEDVKIREMQIFDNKKRIYELETKLRQQQNLYEAVRGDRNLYSKNLIEAQDEITEMKRKLKIMNHQIDQLKDEILTKEACLVKENAEKQKVEKEKDSLNSELQRLRAQAAENKAYIEAQEAEEKKLSKIIVEADAERIRQKKELEQVIGERDILGTQLVRKNDELSLLYEKIKIQQSILNKGEVQYNRRLDDIRLLKLEIKKLRREKNILQKSVANVDDLKREVYHLQHELLRERTRCKALEEELENPMNVHRWRKLEMSYFDEWREFEYLPEGSDPSTFEMIQKIQTLQKRLITKTEEVVEKEMLIQEKEKLYVELKHILARQPGPEVAEQLSMYQMTLKQKNKQLKTLVSETNMYESQIKEYKFELEKLAKEHQDVKQKYFMQKKREKLLKDREQLLLTQENGNSLDLIHPQRNLEQNRFTGGGFNLNQVRT